MRWLRQNFGFILFVLGMVVTRSSFADHYVVPSGSMEPTLMPGDRVVVDKRAYGWRVPFTLTRIVAGEAPARGDVVIFDAPDSGTRLIKRIVAVGGDIVEVRAGRCLINGVPHDKSAIKLQLGGGPDFGPMRVPDGQVFVMGDFRGNSHDSRMFGFVRAEWIYAKAASVYYRSGDGFTWLPL